MTSLTRARRPVRAHRPAVSPRLLLGLAVLVLAALLPGTASAAPERGVLLVEGRGGTVGELVVPEGRLLSFDPMRPVIAGGRTFAGVLIEAVPGGGAQPGRTGVIQVRAFGGPSADAVGLIGVDTQLDSGRYKVTLFGDGPVSVRYDIGSDQPGVRVVPRTPTRMQFLGRAEPLVMGYDEARVELPRSLPAGRRALQVRLLPPGNEVGQAQMCATTGAECENTLPVCAPTPPGCGPVLPPGPRPGGSLGNQPRAGVGLVEPATVPRGFLWSVEGYRDVESRLLAAAIVF